jgi:glycosyltransferase involved in cell wall biosynthesis
MGALEYTIHAGAHSKMKIIVASTIYPFVQGGSTLFVDWLVRALQQRGHEVETLLLPFSSDYKQIMDQMLAIRCLDVSAHGDRLIAIRPPSYLLIHPNKILWFIHHHRAAYDLWGTRYQDIPDSPEGHAYREAIMHADNLAFRESKKIYCNSKVIADRLKAFNRVDAEVLYPPLWDPQRFRTGEFGDYLLYVSRIVDHKRQLLAVEALRFCRTQVRLVIAGCPDPGTQGYLQHIREKISEYHLQSRVTIYAHWISEREKADLLTESLAVIYIPYDEDSYGYPTLEAHHSGKPVITAKDSGGTRELIVDGVNGLITNSEPEALAAAMDRLYNDRPLARRMGEAGRIRMAEMGIEWDTVVDSLVA